jgi:hypothetical protein
MTGFCDLSVEYLSSTIEESLLNAYQLLKGTVAPWSVPFFNVKSHQNQKKASSLFRCYTYSRVVHVKYEFTYRT